MGQKKMRKNETKGREKIKSEKGAKGKDCATEPQ